MSDEDDRRDTIGRLLAMLDPGNILRLDPRAGAYARGNQAIQWSNVVDVNPPPVGVTPAELDSEASFTPVLKVNAAGGAPRLWQVTLGRLPGPGGSVEGGKRFDASRLSWNCGRLVGRATLDLAAEQSCFPIVADSLEIAARNGNPGGAAIRVQASIAPFGGVADWRAPRRTVPFTIPFPFAPFDVVVPRYAQQFTFNTGEPITYTVLYLDDAGTTVSGGILTVNPFPTDLPGGTGIIRFTAGAPTAARPSTLTFRLGL